MNDGNTYNSTYNVTIGILGSIGGDTTPEYNSTYDVTIAILDYLQSHPIGGLPVEVVTELPETGEENKIYLVPSSDPQTQDLFDEYLWIENAWEKVGGASIDLENYYTKDEIDAMLADKQDVIDDLEEIRENAELGATALQPEDIVNSLGPTDADKPISARAVNVDMVNYVDGSISDTIFYVDQQDSNEHAGRVAGDNILSYAISEVDEVTSCALNDLNTRLDGKQNTLTAGANITIVNDVISAAGGGGGMTLMDYDNIDTAIALDIFEEPEKYIIFKEMSSLQTLYFRFDEELNNYKNFCTINQITDMGGDYDLHNNYVISIDYLGQKQFNTVQYKYYNTDEVDELIAGAGKVTQINYNSLDQETALRIYNNPNEYVIYYAGSGTYGIAKFDKQLANQKLFRTNRVLGTNNRWHDILITINNDGTFEAEDEWTSLGPIIIEWADWTTANHDYFENPQKYVIHYIDDSDPSEEHPREYWFYPLSKTWGGSSASPSYRVHYVCTNAQNDHIERWRIQVLSSGGRPSSVIKENFVDISDKQDTLTAGDGIDITGAVISSTVQYDYDSTTYTLNIITE